uniref:Uncharacterized protein n=1 Tax=Acidithiobacillus sulfuriphilus TaxID=1867749 RepID=A0A3M8R630_9PROT|nr:hypothetical protein EC580_06030 [Acidithiobacillus sulfuriphilus]
MGNATTTLTDAVWVTQETIKVSNREILHLCIHIGSKRTLRTNKLKNLKRRVITSETSGGLTIPRNDASPVILACVPELDPMICFFSTIEQYTWHRIDECRIEIQSEFFYFYFQ